MGGGCFSEGIFSCRNQITEAGLIGNCYFCRIIIAIDMKLKTSFFLVFIMIVTVTCLCSCSKENKEQRKRAEATKIIEGRSCKDLLNDLYLSADGDEEALARVLNVTPSAIERLREGTTRPSSQFEDRVKDVAIYYQMNGKSFYRLRSNFDPKWKPIIDTIGCLPKYNPVFYWFILILLVGGVVFCLTVWFYRTWPVFAISATVWILLWLLSLALSPSKMKDPYVDTINPAIEQVI